MKRGATETPVRPAETSPGSNGSSPRVLRIALVAIALLAFIVIAVFLIRRMFGGDDKAAEAKDASPPTAAFATPGAPSTTFAEGAAVRFIQPVDGATVSGPIDFLVDSERVIPARFGQPKPGEGHFVVLLDRACLTPGSTVPVEEGVYNFGTGGSNFRIDAKRGPHEACLQWVDNANVATTLQQTINFTVK